MFKRENATKLFYGMLIVMVMFFTGCTTSGTSYVDTEDKVLPKPFVNVYLFADYSKDFSTFTGELTADLYNRGFINDEEKSEIGEAWKKHKKYNNQLQEELDIWYKDIINGTNNLTDKQRIYRIVENMVFNSNMMFEFLTNQAEDSGIYIPKQLPNRMFNLYNTIEKEKTNE